MTAIKTKTSLAPIKTPEALAALSILRLVGVAKAPMLQKLIGKRLGRKVSDLDFEVALASISERIIRVPGVGGGIYLA